MTIEDISRTWVVDGLAYLSLATDVFLGPTELLQMRAERDVWIMSGERALTFAEHGATVVVDWVGGARHWRVVRYESVRSVPSSVSFKSPGPPVLPDL